MDQNTIRYPIGVQSFRKLRTEGYVYVDKTQYIPLLLRNNYYFLSRPRRFGKSLLLSTLESYFRGQKELFEGLAVYSWEKDWTEYPVVHVDFNRMNGTDIGAVMRSLRRQLQEVAESYGVDLPYAEQSVDGTADIGDIFSQLIHRLHARTRCKVVILVDEYDKGIIEVLHDERRRAEASEALRPFFGVLKSDDELIKFAFITGVSRFRNTTIFSGANNLSDISMDERYASLLGITHQEMTRTFRPAIRDLAARFHWTEADTVSVLRARYDGYRFTANNQLVYNPFSLLNAFDKMDLQSYWVESGSSRSLATYLKGSDFSLDEIMGEWHPASALGSTYTTRSPISLLFQTGYLTIAGHDRDTGEFRLRIPNQEVQKAMSEVLLPEFVGQAPGKEVNRWMSQLRKAVATGDVDVMMQTLRSMLGAVPYHHVGKVHESHLHLCVQIIFLLLGVDTRSEMAVSGGRIDMVASTPWRVYIFEFKLDRSAQEALDQIDRNGYPIPWQADGRTIYKIGVEFSSRLHTIASWTFTRQAPDASC